MHTDRIEKLISVLAVAFCWSYLVGEIKEARNPIREKSHGRKAVSIFRYGFDELRRLFLNPNGKTSRFTKWLNLLIINSKVYSTSGGF